MSIQHLTDLRTALQRSHWCILEELPGNDSNISAVWRVARPDGSHVLHLEFGGVDELAVRPIERAYGITVREARAIGAYFARVERTWPAELEQFVAKLEQWVRSIERQIQASLTDYLRDPSQLDLTVDLAVLARSLEALPVYADMGGALLIRPSCEVLFVHSNQAWDASAQFEVETRPEWRRVAFESCARRFPALSNVVGQQL